MAGKKSLYCIRLNTYFYVISWKALLMAIESPLQLTPLDALSEAAECLRIVAHPHRLRMLQMLLQRDFTVSQLAQACDLPSAMASEHLRLMHRCGFLTSEKSGRKVFYRVIEPHLKDLLKCVEGRFGVSETILSSE